MVGVFYLFFVLLPLILIAAAAVLGLYTARLFSSNDDARIEEEFRLLGAVSIAVGIPVVGAAAVILPTLTNFASWYGDFLALLWIWALAAFAVGLIIGWGYCRQATD